MAMSPTWRRAAKNPRRRLERPVGVTPPPWHTRDPRTAIPIAAAVTRNRAPSGIRLRTAVDRTRAPRFDPLSDDSAAAHLREHGAPAARRVAICRRRNRGRGAP